MPETLGATTEPMERMYATARTQRAAYADLVEVQKSRIRTLVMAMSVDDTWREFTDLHNAVLALETFTVLEQAWRDMLGGHGE